MKNPSWLMPVVILFVCIGSPNPAEADNLPPACTDEKVIEAAIEIMEDFFTTQGMEGSDPEKMTIAALRELSDDFGDADWVKRQERVVARNLKIDKTWVRYCFSPLYGREIMRGRARVAIIMHPYNPGEWGLIVEDPHTDGTVGPIGWGWTNYPYPEKP